MLLLPTEFRSCLIHRNDQRMPLVVHIAREDVLRDHGLFAVGRFGENLGVKIAVPMSAENAADNVGIVGHKVVKLHGFGACPLLVSDEIVTEIARARTVVHADRRNVDFIRVARADRLVPEKKHDVSARPRVGNIGAKLFGLVGEKARLPVVDSDDAHLVSENARDIMNVVPPVFGKQCIARFKRCFVGDFALHDAGDVVSADRDECVGANVPNQPFCQIEGAVGDVIERIARYDRLVKKFRERHSAHRVRNGKTVAEAETKFPRAENARAALDAVDRVKTIQMQVGRVQDLDRFALLFGVKMRRAEHNPLVFQTENVRARIGGVSLNIGSFRRKIGGFFFGCYHKTLLFDCSLSIVIQIAQKVKKRRGKSEKISHEDGLTAVSALATIKEKPKR